VPDAFHQVDTRNHRASSDPPTLSPVFVNMIIPNLSKSMVHMFVHSTLKCKYEALESRIKQKEGAKSQLRKQKVN